LKSEWIGDSWVSQTTMSKSLRKSSCGVWNSAELFLHVFLISFTVYHLESLFICQWNIAGRCWSQPVSVHEDEMEEDMDKWITFTMPVTAQSILHTA